MGLEEVAAKLAPFKAGDRLELIFTLRQPLPQEELDRLQAGLEQRYNLLSPVEETLTSPSRLKIRLTVPHSNPEPWYEDLLRLIPPTMILLIIAFGVYRIMAAVAKYIVPFSIVVITGLIIYGATKPKVAPKVEVRY